MKAFNPAVCVPISRLYHQQPSDIPYAMMIAGSMSAKSSSARPPSATNGLASKPAASRRPLAHASPQASSSARPKLTNRGPSSKPLAKGVSLIHNPPGKGMEPTKVADLPYELQAETNYENSLWRKIVDGKPATGEDGYLYQLCRLRDKYWRESQPSVPLDKVLNDLDRLPLPPAMRDPLKGLFTEFAKPLKVYDDLKDVLPWDLPPKARVVIIDRLVEKLWNGELSEVSSISGGSSEMS